MVAAPGRVGDGPGSFVSRAEHLHNNILRILFVTWFIQVHMCVRTGTDQVCSGFRSTCQSRCLLLFDVNDWSWSRDCRASRRKRITSASSCTSINNNTQTTHKRIKTNVNSCIASIKTQRGLGSRLDTPLHFRNSSLISRMIPVIVCLHVRVRERERREIREWEGHAHRWPFVSKRSTC